jgi:hypothetical protein
MTSTDSSDISTIQPCQNGVLSKVMSLIHHQCSGIELVSPVYTGYGAACYLFPAQRVDVGSTIQVGFNIDLTQGESICILMYELKNTKQFNKDAISSEDEVKCVQLLMILEVNHSKKFCVVSHLIEHDKAHVWDNDRLMRLAKQYMLYDIHIPIEETWLMHDNTVLMTRVNVAREKACYKLEMTLSEASIKYDTQRPLYIGLNE